MSLKDLLAEASELIREYGSNCVVEKTASEPDYFIDLDELEKLANES